MTVRNWFRRSQQKVTLSTSSEGDEITVNKNLANDYAGDTPVVDVLIKENRLQLVVDQSDSVLKHWKIKYGCM